MKEKHFKYPEWRENLPDCPPENYREISMTAFRFVHTDDLHANNFLPVQLVRPNRRFRSDYERCKALGLSFFADENGARLFFRQQSERFEDFGQVVGSQIASIPIVPEDGLASEPETSNFGHFTFHEYLWCDFSVKIITKAPIFES